MQQRLNVLRRRHAREISLFSARRQDKSYIAPHRNPGRPSVKHPTPHRATGARACRVLVWSLLVLSAFTSSVALAAPAKIHRALREAIDRPLPAASEVMGAQPQRASGGLVIVANPDGGTDCAAEGVGRALGFVLRTEMWGTTRDLSFEAPMTYWAASRDRTTPDGLPAGERIARRIGARWIVDGTVSQAAGAWTANWRIVDTSSVVPSATMSTTIRVDQANADLVATIRALLGAMQAEPDADQVPRLDRLAGYPSGAFTALQRAFEGSCNDDGSYAERIASAWREFPGYATLAVLYQQQLALPDRASRRTELTRILSGASAHPVVGFYLNDALTATTPRGEGQAELAALRTLASRYPHEPGVAYALIGALFTYNELYADSDDGRRPKVISGPVDHPLRYAHAIALAGRAIELWPNDYKSWVLLGEATNLYAQAIRGTCGWSCVPDSAKSRLPGINEAFDDIVSKGLMAYPASEPLLAGQVLAAQAMGRDWWPTFLLGAHERPHAYYLYQNAMIYSGDGWGGDAARRRDVYKLALKNNPDEDWPLALYVDWAPWHETWTARYGRVLGIALLLLIAVVGFRWYRARRASDFD